MFQSVKQIIRNKKQVCVFLLILFLGMADILLLVKFYSVETADKTQNKEIAQQDIQTESAVYEPQNYELYTVRNEVFVDVDGNGKAERVNVNDIRSGNKTETSLWVTFPDKTAAAVRYEGYFDSYFVAGDLNGDGATDILLVRGITRSDVGAVKLNAFCFEQSQWKEYPAVFIPNPEIEGEQPTNFESYTYSFLGATIVEGENGNLLRAILLDPNDYVEGKDRVRVVEASYRDTGWFIESIQIVDNYWKEGKESEFLKMF